MAAAGGADGRRPHVAQRPLRLLARSPGRAGPGRAGPALSAIGAGRAYGRGDVRGGLGFGGGGDTRSKWRWSEGERHAWRRGAEGRRRSPLSGLRRAAGAGAAAGGLIARAALHPPVVGGNAPSPCSHPSLTVRVRCRLRCYLRGPGDSDVTPGPGLSAAPAGSPRRTCPQARTPSSHSPWSGGFSAVDGVQ